MSCVEVEGITRNCVSATSPSASCGVGEIRLSRSLDRVQYGAFRYSAISGHLPIKGPIRVLENSAFAFTNLTSVRIGNTVTNIGTQWSYGDGVFANNPFLEKLTFDEPSALTNIGYRAFSECNKLEGDLVVPDSVQSLQYAAFYETNLSSVVIGTGVTKMGRINDLTRGDDDDELYPTGVFEEVKSLKSLTFKEPSQVQSIGAYDFYNTNLLGELIIPDSVTEIGRNAFSKMEDGRWIDGT